MPTVWRSILAVLGGYLMMIAAAFFLTALMVKLFGLQTGHRTGGYLLFNAVATFTAAFVGGFVTATLAADRRVRHGYVLAMVILLMSALAYVHYQGTQPAWYQATLVVVPPLFAILGAKFGETAALAKARR